MEHRKRLSRKSLSSHCEGVLSTHNCPQNSAASVQALGDPLSIEIQKWFQLKQDLLPVALSVLPHRSFSFFHVSSG